MSAQDDLPCMPAPEQLRADLEDDPTPRPVARAVLEALFEYLTELPGDPTSDVFRAADIGAGFGCWSSELRRYWEGPKGMREQAYCDLHITGIEVNHERERHLAKWCDAPQMVDWFDALRDHHEPPTWDLFIGNPPFSELLPESLTTPDSLGYDHDFDGGDWPLGMVGWLLGQAPAVLLLHTQQAFLKSVAGRECWRRYPPAASWLIPGSVKFRRGVNPNTGKAWGADSRCYQATLWLRGHSGPCSLYLLDDLTASERQWVVPPGTETPSAELPAAPGWTP